MSRTTRFLTLLVVTLSMATVARASQMGYDDSPGRYQVDVTDNMIFVIDTRTGECWSKHVAGKSWTRHGSPVEDKVERKTDKPLSLVLPNEVVSVTIKQRRSRTLPGSDSRIRINMDDITAGQVIISISADFKEILLEETSLKPGEIVTFNVNEKKYFLRVKELMNVLIGTDIAVVEVAADRDAFPATDPEPVAAEDDDNDDDR